MKPLTSTIVIIVAITAFFFFVDPRYKEIKLIQAEIDENEKTLEIAKKLTQQNTLLTEKFQQISRLEQEELEKLLPDTVDNVRLIIDIDNIAKQLGLVISGVSIDTDAGPSPDPARTVASDAMIFENVEQVIEYVNTANVGVLSFSFTVSAEYENFLNLLDQLEKSRRIVDIRSIGLSRGSVGPNGVIFYNFDVKFDTYWLK